MFRIWSRDLGRDGLGDKYPKFHGICVLCISHQLEVIEDGDIGLGFRM